MTSLVEVANAIEAAERNRRPTPGFASENGYDISAGYEIQSDLIRRRVERGAHHVGWKLSAVARDAQKRIGANAPVLGQLTSDILVESGSAIDVGDMIDPQVEVEIAIILDKDVQGELPNMATVWTAACAVVPILDLSDSRINGEQKSVCDVIADRASAGLVVLGVPRLLRPDMQIEMLGALLEVNGDVVGSGTAARLLGHPGKAVAEAFCESHQYGIRLRAGDIIATGTLIERIPLLSDTLITASVAELGSVSVRSV